LEQARQLWSLFGAIKERQISESLKLHKGLTGKAVRSRVLELLELVGIKNAETRIKAYPHELSGGQRQRVMIAMALANEPELLIADEPTTALDVTIQAQILELLGELQEKLGMALLLITHDLGIVRKMADHIHVMTQGTVVESGNADEIFNRPQHTYTQHLLSAEPGSMLNRDVASQPVVLSCENIKVSFPIKGGLLGRVKHYVHACDHISLKLKAGRTIGVVGESGSGKTTLGLALLRLIPSEGEIMFKDIAIHEQSQQDLRQLRQSLQIVFQDPYGSLSPRLSIRQIVEEGLLIHQPQLSSDKRAELVSEVLREVGLDDTVLNRFPHEFSGGQRQRIAIARALVLRPEVLILDEPTSALDMSVQAQIVELLKELQDKYQLAYLFISHDLKVVRALSDEIIVMRDGKIVESGPANSVLNHPQQAYTRELMSAAFNIATE